MQFLCVEVARNKEGLNDKVREDHLTDTIVDRCEKLSDAMTNNSMNTALKLMDSLGQHTILTTKVLKESNVGKAMSKLGKSTKFPALAAKARKMTEQWKHGVTLLKVRAKAAKAAKTGENSDGTLSKSAQAEVDIVTAVDFMLLKLRQSKSSQDAAISAEPDKVTCASDLLIDCEKATAENPLSDRIVKEAAACMSEHGVCYFKDVLPTGYVDTCLADAEENVEKAKELLKDLDLDLHSNFDFSEVRHRPGNRVDIRLGLEEGPCGKDIIVKNPTFYPVLQKILGEDVELMWAGIVHAFPDDTPQHQTWHQDGPPLFERHCPVHAVNVFIPLVDLSMELGPTEFYPG
jgi:hypothetical protein